MDSGINRKKTGSTEGCFASFANRRLAAEDPDAPIVLDETRAKPWGKLRLLTLFDQRKACFQGPRSFDRQLGG
jgi:hypothetical protein